MKKTKVPGLRAGVTLCLLIVMLFVLVFSLDTVGSWWSGSAEVRVLFEHVQGLRVSDPVHFHGVPCGRVAALDFRPRFPKTGVAEAGSPGGEILRVAVTLVVPRSVFAMLRSGSEVRIAKTLTGVTIVDVVQGDGAPLEPGDGIQGIEATTLEAVKSDLHQSAETVQRILVGLEKIIAKLREEDLIPGTIRDIRDTGNEARRLAAELREITQSNRDSIDKILANAASFFERMEQVSEELPSLVQKLDTVCARAAVLIADAGGWFRENRASLSASVEDIAATAEGIETLVAEIRRRPWRLLHTPSDDEMLGIDLYESGSAYARGAVEMRRAMTSVEELLAQDPDDAAVEEHLRVALDELTRRVKRLATFEQAFWEKLQQIAD